MNDASPLSTFEHWISSLLTVRLLVVYFCVTILAGIVGFSLAPGPIILGLPLLAQCPFLLIIALHLGTEAIRKIRYSGAPLVATAWPPLMWLAVTVYLFYFACTCLHVVR